MFRAVQREEENTSKHEDPHALALHQLSEDIKTSRSTANIMAVLPESSRLYSTNRNKFRHKPRDTKSPQHKTLL